MKINDRLFELIPDYAESYRNMSDEKAKEFLDRLLSTEKDRIDLKIKHVKRFEKILPFTKVARFFQAENKMDNTMKFDLAEQIPLIGGGNIEKIEEELQ